VFAVKWRPETPFERRDLGSKPTTPRTSSRWPPNREVQLRRGYSTAERDGCNLNVVSYNLHCDVLKYKAAVMQGDYSTADRVLQFIPQNELTTLADFLEEQASLIFFITSYIRNYSAVASVGNSSRFKDRTATWCSGERMT
jgi:hypothetical protein